MFKKYYLVGALAVIGLQAAKAQKSKMENIIPPHSS